MIGLTMDLRRFPVAAGLRRAVAAPVALLLAALLAAACVFDNPEGTNPAARKDSVVPSESLAGNYLAGRHAQARGDLSAAAEFLGAALQQAPDTPNLLRRTLMLMAMEGRMAEAADLARRVVAVNAKAPIAGLTVVVDDIGAGLFAEAEERLAGLSNNGFNVVMVPLLSAWVRVGLGKPDAALAALEPLAEKDGSRALHDLHAALINETAGRTEAAEKQYLRVADRQNGPSLRVVQLLGPCTSAPARRRRRKRSTGITSRKGRNRDCWIRPWPGSRPAPLPRSPCARRSMVPPRGCSASPPRSDSRTLARPHCCSGAWGCI